VLTRMCLVAVAACMVASGTISSQGDYNPGERWLRLDRDSRLIWLWGAAEGQSLLVEELSQGSRKGLKNVIPLDSADAIRDIMTQYYGDKANTYIPWKYLAVAARMKLEGSTDAALNERLRSLREYAASVRSKKQPG
jgi:hypothetical protein